MAITASERKQQKLRERIKKRANLAACARMQEIIHQALSLPPPELPVLPPLIDADTQSKLNIIRRVNNQVYNIMRLRRHRGVKRKHAHPLDPLGPTLHPPSSDGKMAVLEDRARRRVALFHPEDAGWNIKPEADEDDLDRTGKPG